MSKENHDLRSGLADYLRQHPHPGGIIVCENLRFIYMKAPRTGGTSILRETLEKLPLDIFHYKDHQRRFESWTSQLTDEQLADYFIFIFSFVHNPWDRAVSIASYFQIPFPKFACEFDELVANNKNLFQHSLPLHRYTHLSGQSFVDFVGRFETLQADFDRLCEILGLEQRQLPLASQSQHKHYREYYDEEVTRRIDALYGRDAELFEYQFAGTSEQEQNNDRE